MRIKNITGAVLKLEDGTCLLPGRYEIVEKITLFLMRLKNSKLIVVYES